MRSAGLVADWLIYSAHFDPLHGSENAGADQRGNCYPITKLFILFMAISLSMISASSSYYGVQKGNNLIVLSAAVLLPIVIGVLFNEAVNSQQCDEQKTAQYSRKGSSFTVRWQII